MPATVIAERIGWDRGHDGVQDPLAIGEHIREVGDGTGYVI